MRPRQACLGILSMNYDDAVKKESFNEAEASLPRNTQPSHSLDGSRMGGFNEAEASLPRNTLLMLNTSFQLTCFNEAEASLPRNTLTRHDESAACAAASMRPRQACLGILFSSPPPLYLVVLASMRPRQACLGIRDGPNRHGRTQCRFNEAEASLPRNTLLIYSQHNPSRQLQ